MSDSKPPKRSPPPNLRERGEAALAKIARAAGGGRSAEELLHELEVHQVELEMQNEELRQSRLALELARDRYADLYDFAPVGYFTVGADGVIREANLTGAGLLGVARGKLIKRGFAGFVDAADRERWSGHLARVLQSDGKHSCELALRRQDGSLFAARVDCLRAAAGDGAGAAASYLIRTAVSDITDLKRADRERAAHAERLNQMAQRLATIQEVERKRLSMELHDRTSTNLAALRVNLASIAAALPAPLPPALEVLLADTAALVEDANASIREISSDLRPPVLDYGGLLAALVSHGRHLGRRTGITVSVDGTGLLRRPNQEHEALLFRIANEALTNSAKHAGAKTIRVVLANDGAKVVMTIMDDGIGFDEGRLAHVDEPPGHGLLTMRERAEFAGGSFHVESAPGRGTRIEVIV